MTSSESLAFLVHGSAVGRQNYAWRKMTEQSMQEKQIYQLLLFHDIHIISLISHTRYHDFDIYFREFLY
jgi:hypothetical protein